MTGEICDVDFMRGICELVILLTKPRGYHLRMKRVALALGLAAPLACAQTFPERPVAREIPKWAKVVKDSGARAE